jgi:hypothetical protein
MFTKILRGFTNSLLALAGVPSRSPEEAAPDEAELRASFGQGKAVQMVPVKNFLHYL